ncbi:MAG TPA: homoserine O-acetyltransferase [Planctomycetota bacterium]|nr:homoserine O-acetyltransferase [Planctomycetota bacterium]
MAKPKNPSIAEKYDPPDAPNSVGWTAAQRIVLATPANPLPLDCGETIAPVEVEYETYGRLNADKSNAVLICHALSGDAHAAGWDQHTERKERAYRKKYPGWWDSTIGPGKAFDTNKYFVICSNVLGSCYGTTSPACPNPKAPAGAPVPYGLDFPVVTVSDWVRLQKRLIDALGIPKLLCVAGGSLGGQQALDWTLQFPDSVASAMILAASAKLSSQGIGFNKIGRHAIASDPAFKNGAYYGGEAPSQGLAVARMIGHLTYLSEESMNVKFGRRLRRREAPGFHFDIDYEVESYLDHQGRTFTERFDANSYLYITKAMDYYDAAAEYGEGDLVKALERVTAVPLIVSFSSDWLYPPAQCRALAEAFCKNRKPVTYVDVPSIYGHDAFLVETERMNGLIRGFLNNQSVHTGAAQREAPRHG